MRDVFVPVLLLVVATACGVADLPDATPGSAAVTAGAGSTANAAHPTADGGCATAASKTAAPPCTCAKGGHARCVPVARLSSSLSSQLAPCGDNEGKCVPDAILDRPGPLPVCQTRGKPGRCLDLCVPLVGDSASLLDRGDGDACASEERCVPCDHPTTGKPTGACTVEPPTNLAGSPSGCEATATGGGATPPPENKACCAIGGTARGQCVPRASVARALQSRVAARECDGADLCAPLPTGRTCGGGIGVCVNACVSVGIGEQLFLDGSCPADERCATCFLFTGEPTGLPGCR